jgi:hypothetical protein
MTAKKKSPFPVGLFCRQLIHDVFVGICNRISFSTDVHVNDVTTMPTLWELYNSFFVLELGFERRVLCL